MKSPVFLLALLATPLVADVSVEKDETSATVTIDGELFTKFNSDAALPYLYPVLSTDEVNLTRHYPMKEGVEHEPTDHPHHRSFWVAHGDVNGIDFWHGKGTIDLKEIVEAESGEDSGTLKVALEWNTGEEVLLEETRTYTFSQPDEDTRVVVVDCELTAMADEVTFGDTKEGTFAIRVAPTLQNEGKVGKGIMANSEGDRGDDIWGKSAAWAAFYGPDPEGNPVAVIMTDHPENPRYPTWWHARGYGLFAANPFGKQHFEKDQPEGAGKLTLKKGESVRFRHRVAFHSGEVDQERLSKLAEWR